MAGTLRFSMASALASALLCIVGSATTVAAKPKSVVELYTSQGCSSCPKADALLKHYAKDPGIVALSFNVDYWDYLGWKDTLARKAHTKRQYAYASKRGDARVYTPQIIVNGMNHAVGSHRAEIDHAINRTADELSGSHAPLTLETANSKFVIRIGKAQTRPAKPATVYVAIVTPAITVKIKRGENRDRRITYHNVVRNLMPVGMWSGEETVIHLRPQDLLEAKSKQRCAVIVQAANLGPILAADWMPDHRRPAR